MGEIQGINHILLVCKDMNRTVDFYCNVLGLKVLATAGGGPVSGVGLSEFKAANTVRRNYHLATADGTDIVFSELPENDCQADGSLFVPGLWPGEHRRPQRPTKVDHIAFNVKSRDDLAAIQSRLRERGVLVSEIIDRPPSDAGPMFVKSIYFYDPDGIPLEVATWDRADPNWAKHKDEDYLRDPEPVASLPKR